MDSRKVYRSRSKRTFIKKLSGQIWLKILDFRSAVSFQDVLLYTQLLPKMRKPRVSLANCVPVKVVSFRTLCRKYMEWEMERILTCKNAKKCKLQK